jgi:hypothetical protein
MQMRDAVRDDVQNLHLDMIRQFHLQQAETRSILEVSPSPLYCTYTLTYTHADERCGPRRRAESAPRQVRSAAADVETHPLSARPEKKKQAQWQQNKDLKEEVVRLREELALLKYLY